MGKTMEELIMKPHARILISWMWFLTWRVPFSIALDAGGKIGLAILVRPGKLIPILANLDILEAD
jgi:hypothetical protein